MDKIRYQWSLFSDLDTQQLYRIMQLRQEVFIVEQNCAYLDADSKDQQALHLLALCNDELMGYLRIILPDNESKRLVIGRVIIHMSFRRKGLGKELLLEALYHCKKFYPHHSIQLSAQLYLKSFYEKLGFDAISHPYDEDGIEHIKMVKVISSD